ncbi:MAG: M20/M25/M40 family metallo-hydrolase [Mucinivorans sp.]
MKNIFIELLGHLIAIPSVSCNEAKAADFLQNFLADQGVSKVHRRGDNIWAYNRDFDPSRATILLVSHIDTVAASEAYTRDPFLPTEQDGRLYGLGSNDAGGSVVALTATFLHFYRMQNLGYNLCLALVAQEECGGSGGMRLVMDDLGKMDFAIVGEPTEMKMAIGERGLMVLDCTARGRTGHAARQEGINAIYIAMNDIAWLTSYRFARSSDLFGSVKMSVTVIKAGTVHNVVPATCDFTIDVRVSEQYTLQEVFDTIQENLTSTVLPRSMRHNPSSIALTHPLVEIGLAMGVEYYGSPTTSDAAVLSPLPCLKMGPGSSARSHSADEFIEIEQVEQAIDQYIAMLTALIVK